MALKLSTRRRLLRIQHRSSMFGNLCFLTGSLFFLSEKLQTAGVLLFVAGSLGLVVGGILPTLVRLWICGRESASGEEDCAGSTSADERFTIAATGTTA